MCKITMSYWSAFYALSSDLELEPSRVEGREEESGEREDSGGREEESGGEGG